MRFDLKKNEKIVRAISVICLGILAMFVFSNPKTKTKSQGQNNMSVESEKNRIEIYEEKRITKILDSTYGVGTCSVTVNIKEESNQSFYDEKKSYFVTAVCIVTSLKDDETKAEIIYSISSLYSLPTHKVTVMQKK